MGTDSTETPSNIFGLTMYSKGSKRGSSLRKSKSNRSAMMRRMSERSSMSSSGAASLVRRFQSRRRSSANTNNSSNDGNAFQSYWSRLARLNTLSDNDSSHETPWLVEAITWRWRTFLRMCGTARNFKSIIASTFIVFAILCGAGLAAVLLFANEYEEDKIQAAEDLAKEMGFRIPEILNQALVPLFTMEQLVLQLETYDDLPLKTATAPFLDRGGRPWRNVTGICDDPSYTVPYDNMAASVKKSANLPKMLVNVQLAPTGVLCLLHPLINYEDFDDGIFMNNTGARGLDLINDPVSGYYTREAIKDGRVTIQGPLSLVQGGISIVKEALIVRNPIFQEGSNFTTDGETYSFWGFSTVLLNWFEMKKKLDLDNFFESAGADFSMTRTDTLLNFTTNEVYNQVRVIAQSERGSDLNQKNSVTVPLQTTDNEWILTVGFSDSATAPYKVWGCICVIVGSFVISMVLMIVLVIKKEHEVLLYRMMPREVINRIHKGETVIEKYDLATICIIDVVSFTTLSEQMKPIEVMAMLKDLFTILDKLALKHKVYNVETIGDAYIVIGGGAERCSGRMGAQKVASFALEAIEQLRNFSFGDDLNICVRAGLASGLVVAGVLGKSSPKYTLFGDTVTVATKMESTSKSMQIQCSRLTFLLLRDSYNRSFVLEQRCDGHKVTESGPTWWIRGESERELKDSSFRAPPAISAHSSSLVGTESDHDDTQSSGLPSQEKKSSIFILHDNQSRDLIPDHDSLSSGLISDHDSDDEEIIVKTEFPVVLRDNGPGLGAPTLSTSLDRPDGSASISGLVADGNSDSSGLISDVSSEPGSLHLDAVVEKGSIVLNEGCNDHGSSQFLNNFFSSTVPLGNAGEGTFIQNRCGSGSLNESGMIASSSLANAEKSDKQSVVAMNGVGFLGLDTPPFSANNGARTDSSDDFLMSTELGTRRTSQNLSILASEANSTHTKDSAAFENYWSKLAGANYEWQQPEDEKNADLEIRITCWNYIQVVMWKKWHSIKQDYDLAIKHRSIWLSTIVTFACLCAVGLTAVLLLSEDHEEGSLQKLVSLAEEADRSLLGQLNQALFPLFVLAELVKEVTLFKDLVPRVVNSTTYEKNGKPFRNVSGICDDSIYAEPWLHAGAATKKAANLPGILVNLQVAPDGIVCLLHPKINYADFDNGLFMDSSGALGHDVKNDIANSYYVQESIEKQRVTIQGPLLLIQRNTSVLKEALIARSPVFIDNYNQTDVFGFWGFTTVLLNWAKLKEKVNIYGFFEKHGVEFVMTRSDLMVNPTTNEEYKDVVVIAESNKSGSIHECCSISYPLHVTDNDWVLKVGYTTDHLSPRWKRWGCVVVMIGSFLASLVLLLLLVDKKEHELLLYRMMPREVIHRLQSGDTVVQTSSNATIFFSHIIGFKTLSGQMKPREFMIMLNQIYEEFDMLVRKHQVNKVETIGDAYIVTSRPSNGDKENGVSGAEMVALFALDAMAFVRTYRYKDMRVFVRSGLATGPVVSGVIGAAVPKYTIFGDTVNYASRMESTSRSMRIQCSESTFKLLCDSLSFTFLTEERKEGDERGIYVKGKGMVHTWWIQDARKKNDTISTSSATALPSSEYSHRTSLRSIENFSGNRRASDQSNGSFRLRGNRAISERRVSFSDIAFSSPNLTEVPCNPAVVVMLVPEEPKHEHGTEEPDVEQ